MTRTATRTPRTSRKLPELPAMPVSKEVLRGMGAAHHYAKGVNDIVINTGVVTGGVAKVHQEALSMRDDYRREYLAAAMKAVVLACTNAGWEVRDERGNELPGLPIVYIEQAIDRGETEGIDAVKVKFFAPDGQYFDMIGNVRGLVGFTRFSGTHARDSMAACWNAVDGWTRELEKHLPKRFF